MITFVYSGYNDDEKFECSDVYFLDTEKAWILQTYLKMRLHGIAVEIAKYPPEAGIFVACAYKMHPSFIPNNRQWFISVSADGPPHFGADMHIVQNKIQARLLPSAYFVPHWPQPGLVGRDPSRGEVFENVAYIGDAVNLHPALQAPSWAKKLERMGINWIVYQQVDRDPADMRDIDAIVAVRSFRKAGFIRKPASKLVNALLADVPSICGSEFAFREVGQPGFCFVEVRSLQQTLQSIQRIKSDPDFRNRLVANGRVAVQAYNEASVLAAWKEVLELCGSGESFPRKTKYPRFRAAIRRKILGLQHRVLKSVGLQNFAL